jgi:hypothetical protein
VGRVELCRDVKRSSVESASEELKENNVIYLRKLLEPQAERLRAALPLTAANIDPAGATFLLHGYSLSDNARVTLL